MHANTVKSAQSREVCDDALCQQSYSTHTRYDEMGRDIKDIYSAEVNTKYILFIAVKEKQYFSRVRSTTEKADIFTARDEIYLVFTQKSKSSFYFIHQAKQ